MVIDKVNVISFVLETGISNSDSVYVQYDTRLVLRFITLTYNNYTLQNKQ